MSDTNSIWPNGMQKDADGYAVFYPMGTNKVEIPKNSPHWPKGNKLVGQFVYKDDKLVGFCDTKAMTTENSGIVVMPYEYIDTEFDSIPSGSIQIHAPKAVVKKASWTGGERIDIPDVQYKYKGCTDVGRIKAVDANYLENDIIDGKWFELLSDLINSAGMFQVNENITSFTSDMTSATHAPHMFQDCPNLITFESDLSSLSVAYQMFYNCTNLITFKSSNLSSLTNAFSMFQNCEKLSSFTSDLSSLGDGKNMFNTCSNLNTFQSNLKSLTDGLGMFRNCSNLTSFESNLNSLKGGTRMFSGCSNLVTFKSDLKSLTVGSGMFQNCSNLTSFNVNNLSSLTTADLMFHNCKNLKSFNSDLKSLTNGNSLFQNCSNLTSFNSNLSSLETAQYIFHGCKLDATSIKNVIDTINKIDSSKLLSIGMGCDNNQTDKDLFAQEVGYTDMTSLLAALQNKGWIVNAQFNGRPNSTFSLRKPDSLPVFVKLVEVIPTEENSFYEYTSSDETKFYNLDWFHETTGSTDGYETFQSLEEAITHFNIKQIEK